MNYKGYKHLTRDQRLKIEGDLKTGATVAEIAAMVGKCKKTIYNEIKRGLCLQQREGYIFEEVSIVQMWRIGSIRSICAQKGRT